jgi:hypothetical protein
MIVQIKIAGKRLDLPAKTSVQFVKNNILFAFDKVSFERSTTIQVPKTRNNLQILGFSQDYHDYGTSMRISMEAEMICGVLSRKGYLYINQYDYEKQEFECIFLTGELLGLKGIKELGNIAEYIPQELGARVDATGYASNDPNQPDYGIVFYETDREGHLPSWRLGALADEVFNNANVSIDLSAIRSILDNERIIVPSNYNLVPLTGVEITRTYLGMPQPPISGQDYPIIGEMASNSSVFAVEKSATPLMMIWDSEATDFRRGYVNELVCLQTLEITFPDDTPNDLFLGYVQSGSVAFLGDYSFNDSQVIGTPLAGRTITLQSGQHFYFVFRADRVRGGVAPYEGWWFANRNITLNVQIEGVTGESNFIRVRDNVPEMNVIELLKMIAAVTGRVLNYDGTSIVFEQLQGGWYRVLRLTDVVSVGKVVRTFGDFAQNNFIEFDSAEYVTNRVRLNYAINNANIAKENILHTIPMSEFGTKLGIYGIKSDFIPQDSEAYTFAANTTGFYMGNIDIPANATISSLVDTSTTIQVSARISLLEYDSINQKTILYYDGAYWVWNDMTWSNGIAEITMARFRLI